MSDSVSEYKLLGMVAVQDVNLIKADLSDKIDLPELTINLEAVDHLDTTVVQCLYAAIKHRHSIGLETDVIGVNDIVKEVLGGLGMLEVFGVSS